MAVLTQSEAGGGNGVRVTGQADWATARSQTTGTTTNFVIDNTKVGAGNFQLSRGFFWFNTASIGQGSTISAAVFRHPAISNNTNDEAITVHVVGHTGTETTIAGADIDQIGATSYGSVLMSGLSTSVTTDISLNATGLAAINKGGNTAIGLIGSLDKDNTSPNGINQYTITVTSPVLEVTYTPVSGGQETVAFFIG